MKVMNFYGLSYHFMPSQNVVANNLKLNLVMDLIVEGNKILFFDGGIPSASDLYDINSENQLLNAYGDRKLMEISDLKFVYKYDKETKTKTIKKVPVDAIDVPFEKDGTIGWAAIILNDANNADEADKIILFTDTIGGWGDQTSPIILDKFTGKAKDNNIFKDFSLIIRDVPNNEIAEEQN
jgi:hypothetical protein